MADDERDFFERVAASDRNRIFVEAVVDLAGIDQIAALAAADIDAVPFVAVEREAGDGQRLALSMPSAAGTTISPSMMHARRDQQRQ